jgi:hypothetical protein
LFFTYSLGFLYVFTNSKKKGGKKKMISFTESEFTPWQNDKLKLLSIENGNSEYVRLYFRYRESWRKHHSVTFYVSYFERSDKILISYYDTTSSPESQQLFLDIVHYIKEKFQQQPEFRLPLLTGGIQFEVENSGMGFMTVFFHFNL